MTSALSRLTKAEQHEAMKAARDSQAKLDGPTDPEVLGGQWPCDDFRHTFGAFAEVCICGLLSRGVTVPLPEVALYWPTPVDPT